MRILALNGASGASGLAFGLLRLDGDTLAVEHEAVVPGRDGAALPVALAQQLHRLGWTAAGIDLIAVVVGPGSFTGLRAALALAHGVALGGRAELVGVTIGEALTLAARAWWPCGELWCVSQARRGRVFIENLDRPAPVEAAMLAALPRPDGPVGLVGDAAGLVAEALGGTAQASTLVAPSAAEIAAAALQRRAGRLPALAVQPLYVDPPEARLPQATLSQPRAHP